MRTLIDETTNEAVRIVRDQCGPRDFSHVWPTRNHGLFRLGDERTGVVEAMVNWGTPHQGRVPAGDRCIMLSST